MVDIDVGGTVNHVQKGMKIELGVASDHLVIYADPNDLLESRDTIERATRLHQYAKELKSGMVPRRGQDVEDPLATQLPGQAK